MYAVSNPVAQSPFMDVIVEWTIPSAAVDENASYYCCNVYWRIIYQLNIFIVSPYYVYYPYNRKLWTKQLIQFNPFQLLVAYDIVT